MSSKLTRTELVLVLLLAVASTFAVARYSYYTTHIRHLDSTFLFESLENIRQTGLPMSGTVNSLPTMFKLFRTPPETYCAASLDAINEPYLVLHNHAYLLLYPLALLAYFISPEALWALFNAFAHLALLFLPYVYLRWRGIPVLTSVLFVACVAFYAGWSLSMTGDYYMDRLYMLFIAPLLFGIHVLTTSDRATRRGVVLGLVLALCAALCTERAAIMVIGVLCFYLLFYRAELKGKGVLALMIAAVALLVVYLGVYFALLFEGLPGAGTLLSNRIDSVQGLVAHLLSPGGQVFLLVNFLPLGLFALFSGYRYLLLVIGALLPNVLFTIGGGELTGWDMHYHVMYVPIIVFVACVGYERIMRGTAANRALAAAVPLGVAAVVSIVAAYLHPMSGFQEERTFAGVNDGILGRVWTHYSNREASYEAVWINMFSSMVAGIPPGAAVSTMETAMPALYRGRRLSYFPLGLSTSDYLVVVGTATQGKLATLEGWVTYLDPKGDADVKQCLIDRIHQLGYTVAQDFPHLRYVVMKRSST